MYVPKFIHMFWCVSVYVYVVHPDTPNGSTAGVGESDPICIHIYTPYVGAARVVRVFLHVCMYMCARMLAHMNACTLFARVHVCTCKYTYMLHVNICICFCVFLCFCVCIRSAPR